MKRGLLIALAACSSKTSAPPPGSGSAITVTPVVKYDAARADLELPAAGVTDLDVHPKAAFANHIVADWKSPRPDAAIMCRVDAFNLVRFHFYDEAGMPEGSHLAEWSPGPFTGAPEVCEIRFYGEHHERLANACYRKGQVSPDMCGLAPQQEQIDGSDVLLDHVELSTGANRVALHALYTLVSAPIAHVTYEQTIRCGNIRGHAISDDTHLDRLELGDSVYTPVVFEMSKEVPKDPPPRCELEIASSLPDKPKRVRATFCIAGTVAATGRCK